MEFKFNTTLSSGLPVEVEGEYKSRNMYQWFAYHIDLPDNVYCFGEDDLGVVDNKTINRKVENYCEDLIVKIGDYDGKY